MGPVIGIDALMRTLKVYDKVRHRIHAASRGWHCKTACKLNRKTIMILKAYCSWKWLKKLDIKTENCRGARGRRGTRVTKLPLRAGKSEIALF